MDQERWTAVDDYFGSVLALDDAALDGALASSRDAGLPEIQVAPNQGRLLHLLARAMGAKRILEIGTLGGYSAIWLARALPEGGRLVTLEAEPKHAEVAKANLARAHVAHLVEIRVGPALETLPGLVAEGAGPFDLVFVDADKPSLPEYLEWSLRLARPGTMLVFDNVVRKGGILDEASTDAAVRGTRRLFERLAAEPRLRATALQTVGTKGWDGLAFALVTG